MFALAIKRTDLATALAKATAAREDSNRRLVELKKRQAELQTASLANWSNKLAMFKNDSIEFNTVEKDIPFRSPVEVPVPETTSTIYTTAMDF